jgi:hypothetical protein
MMVFVKEIPSATNMEESFIPRNGTKITYSCVLFMNYVIRTLKTQKFRLL